MKILKNNIAFIFLALIFSVSIYFSITISMASSEDKIIYLAEDTYKDMSIAGNLSRGLGWGRAENGVVPSNSVIYPVMLGVVYKIFGVRESIPLIVNIMAGFLVICLIWFFLRKEDMWQISAMTTGFFMYLSSSLPYLIMRGNWIIILIAASLVLVYYASEPAEKKGRGGILVFFSALLGGISPEGLVVAAAAVIILAAAKEYLTACIMLLAAVIIPVSGFVMGIWNGYEDFGFFKPEQITGILSMREYLFPLAALLVTAIAAAVKKGTGSKYAVICRVVLAATLLKILFMKSAGAQESVLFTSLLSIFSVSIAGYGLFPDEPEKNLKTGVILTSCFFLYLTFLYPMVKRGINTYSLIPDMSRNTYERSYRLGLFVKECCDKKAVVSDNAGAMTYLADIDFIGIGNAAPLRFKEENLKKIIENKSAVISIASAENTEKYFKYFPKESVKIREWVIYSGSGKKESLVFYCLKESERKYISAKLNNFSAYLPPDVKVK